MKHTITLLLLLGLGSGLGFGLSLAISDTISFGLSGSWDDDITVYGIGGRVYFGN